MFGWCCSAYAVPYQPQHRSRVARNAFKKSLCYYALPLRACRTVALLELCHLPVKPPPEMTSEQFREIMAVDKKVKDGKLRLILLKGELGGCVVTGDFDDAKLQETLDHFCGAQ